MGNIMERLDENRENEIITTVLFSTKDRVFM